MREAARAEFHRAEAEWEEVRGADSRLAIDHTQDEGVSGPEGYAVYEELSQLLDDFRGVVL